MLLWLGALVLLTGRQEAAASKARRQQAPDLYSFYRSKLPNIEPGDFTFETVLLRAGAAPLNLDSAVESLEWRDEEAVLAGSLQLRRPIADDRTSLPIGRGHRIRLRVRWEGRWYELWQMRCLIPDTDPATGAVSVELLDDLDLLRRDLRDWNIRAGARRPRGITTAVAARRALKGIPVRKLPSSRARLHKLVRKDHSILDVLRAIYVIERRVTHRKYVIRWVDGAVEVTTFARNRVLYVFEKQIMEALLKVEGQARPYTVVEARGTVGKGKAAQKITWTEQRRDIVARFGRTTQKKNYGRVDSLADLKMHAKRTYAHNLRLTYSATLTVPGVPFIRRGDGVEVRIPSEGYTGDDAMVYTTRVVHRVDSGGYTTEMDVNRVDPFERDRERREAELLKLKSAKRRAAG